MHQHDECAVCLNPVEETQLIRKLCNCRHVFHKHCLDSWIDETNVTCPLCRAHLLPAATTDVIADELSKWRDAEEDPWLIN